MSDDARRTMMSEFEVSHYEVLRQRGAYVPVVVPYFDKFTADGKEKEQGEFDNLGENYLFKLGEGVTPEDMQRIASEAVAVEKTRAEKAEQELSDRIDAIPSGGGGEGVVSAFIGMCKDEWVVPEPGESSDDGEDDSSPDEYSHLFEVEPLDSTGDSISLVDGVITCKKGWYHVDTTFYITPGGPAADYAPLWLGVGVNKDFSEYQNYDRADCDTSRDNILIRHVNTLVHVTADGGTIDIKAACEYPGICVYLDQVSVCKISVPSGGSGGSGDIVVMHIDDAVLSDVMSGDGSATSGSTQLWEDMIDVILDGKVLAVTMPIEEGIGAYAFCTTYYKFPQGYPKEAVKAMLRENDALGSLNFMFETYFYGGLVTLGIKVIVSPSMGLVPYYFYMTTASMGIALEMQAIDYESHTKAIAGEVLGFSYDEVTGAYTASYGKLPLILDDLQNQGKSITLTGSNKNFTYALTAAPVKVHATSVDARENFALSFTGTAQYIGPDIHEGEIHPVMWQGSFRFMEMPDNPRDDGLYVLDADKTYVLQYTLIENSSDGH